MGSTRLEERERGRHKKDDTEGERERKILESRRLRNGLRVDRGVRGG